MNKFIKYILILFLIIFIGVNMSITKYSPEDITGLAERLWRMEQDIKNLKMERKVYFSDAMRGQKWLDWAPTYGAQSPMTFTSITTVSAKYCVIDGVVFFMLGAHGTTGGTASPAIYFTPPVAVDLGDGGGCRVIDGARVSGYWVFGTTTRIEVYKYNESNWGLGIDRGIYVQGFYKMAG